MRQINEMSDVSIGEINTTSLRIPTLICRYSVRGNTPSHLAERGHVDVVAFSLVAALHLSEERHVTRWPICTRAVLDGLRTPLDDLRACTCVASSHLVSYA